MGGALRFTTWLAPGLPEGLFEVLAADVSAGLGRSYELSIEPNASGPTSGADDRFASGDADVGFVCPLSYLWLTGQPRPSIALVPVAPVFDDPRADGRPVYFADVMVRYDSQVETFEDLRDRRVGFNDCSSLSGYAGILGRLAAHGLDSRFFAEFSQVGSHHRALALVADGRLDAAAVDANVRRRWEVEHPDRPRLVRSIATLGPFPVQPIVVRAELADQLLAPISHRLLRPELAELVRPYGVVSFGPVSSEDYEALRSDMARAVAADGTRVD